jgi:hypothetical protein
MGLTGIMESVFPVGKAKTGRKGTEVGCLPYSVFRFQ